MAVTLTMTACEGKGKELQPTATKDQAVQRVEELIQESFTQLPAGATLKINENVDAAPCDDPTDGGPAGRIFAEKRYFIVPPAAGSWDQKNVIPTLVTFWQQKGYTTHTDDRNGAEPRFTVQTSDGYRISVDSWDRSDHVDISLGSTSPCVWENGTPDPQ
ncbi:hypothetical protein [Actinoplanes sp. HUAS TT8]|uniref:hypothetical protein n=1 Tax=Actinoplanes sp. HUAS TT8 TaxID=3447453 RepID=UPI003F526E70